MSNNLAGVHTYGDALTVVYQAPLGTTAPTALAAPDVAFKDVGFLGDAGITLSNKVTVSKFKAWQGGQLVKTKVTDTERSFKFVALEENAVTFGLMYPGATGATATSVSTITVPAGTTSDPRAWVVDLYEGTSVQTRYIIPNGTVGDRGDVAFKNDALTAYEFTVDIIGGFTIVTNSGAVTYP